MAAVTDPDAPVPFDETAVTRGRRKCFFCEADKSDEWKFLARLNAFVCKACLERIEKARAEEQKAG
jgi:hypothetical protein